MQEIMIVKKVGNISIPNNVSSKKRFARGQGMTEYIVIVALIAVAAIGVYQYFGQVVRGQMAAIASEVGGVDGKASVELAGAAADKANKETGKKGLDSFEGARTAAAATK